MSEAPTSVIKISETDPMYTHEREIHIDPMDFAFGYNVVRALKLIKFPEGSMQRQVAEKTLPRNMGSARHQLGEVMGSRRSGEYVDQMLEEAMGETADNSNLLFNYIAAKGRTDLAYEIDNIPDDVFQYILTNHVGRFRETLGEFQTAIPFFQDSFQRRFAQKIIARGFIDNETVQRRMAGTIVVLGDALRDDLTADRGGYFDSETDTVMIAQQDFENLGEHLYTHEMLHALSGRTLVLRTDAPLAYMEFEAQRIGFRFQNVKQGRFRWLNEAITEELAIGLTGDKEDRIYKQERNLYKLLRTKGKMVIPEELFLAAYFENYDPSLPPGERIPQWKKLYSAINEAYEPGFLVRLDKMIQKGGIETALLFINLQPSLRKSKK